MKTDFVEVTPAQKALLKLLSHKEAKDHYESLKRVHYLGTYCVDSDITALTASRYVQDLLDVLQQIALEFDAVNNDFKKTSYSFQIKNSTSMRY